MFEHLEKGIDVFLRKTKRHECGCLIWQGKPKDTGYGQFKLNGFQDYTHRWAWFFYYGNWPSMFVCHSCDNRMCVEKEHLFLGTNWQNMRDAAKKHKMGAPRKLSRGFRELIKERLASGIPQRQIAKEFGTSQATVSEINRGLYDSPDRVQDLEHRRNI